MEEIIFGASEARGGRGRCTGTDPLDSCSEHGLHVFRIDVIDIALKSRPKQQQQQQQLASIPKSPLFFASPVVRWTLAGSPRTLPSVGRGDDCVLLGDMSSSRSPRPLPCLLTTQLHRDRRRQEPRGGGARRSTRPHTGRSPPPPLSPRSPARSSSTTTTRACRSSVGCHRRHWWSRGRSRG